MSFQQGTYYLINVKHAKEPLKDKEEKHKEEKYFKAEDAHEVGQRVAAMDLSEGDGQSIIAFEWHGGENQKWIFEPTDNGHYYIQNAGLHKYLTFPDEPNDGKQVIATDGPREWEVRVGQEGHDDREAGRDSIRIFVPGTNQNLDLTNHGDITPGNPVQLWEQTPGQGQAWYAVPA
ncbi:hypothetical protein RSOLAG22IIIB_08651 [Rhizoctonia solani]|uniref:Ricin B lectin domain-containing protein n=1 Tax=Rhizoctonia solani TaxID=456999 RepID=A0A0K6FTW6_9AGAM|nr:hypothetical protein RSOLAG22IIIB_08651 [Rhizoctonia solani]